MRRKRRFASSPQGTTALFTTTETKLLLFESEEAIRIIFYPHDNHYTGTTEAPLRYSQHSEVHRMLTNALSRSLSAQSDAQNIQLLWLKKREPLPATAAYSATGPFTRQTHGVSSDACDPFTQQRFLSDAPAYHGMKSGNRHKAHDTQHLCFDIKCSLGDNISGGVMLYNHNERNEMCSYMTQS